MYSTESKIVNKETLVARLTAWRLKSDKIVWTNGCFDILHLGHVDYLEKSKALGTRLVVGLNSDESVKKIKEAGRPVQDEISRARILAALHFVDAVILFDEETPRNMIEFVKPDVLVKGSDYSEDQIVGADFVKSNGGSVETVKLVEGHSTSGIIEKVKSL